MEEIADFNDEDAATVSSLSKAEFSALRIPSLFLEFAILANKFAVEHLTR